ncbi:MAG: DUF1566 domain-containing protein [Burkholderiales bacterium]|nr:DUF1566 domain-containing protein [Burkholderiales bacterium]
MRATDAVAAPWRALQGGVHRAWPVVVRWSFVVAAAVAAGAAAAAEPALVPSADGSELVDAAAGLTWARCVEGMQWDGRTCVGAPLRLTHGEAAGAAAARRRADGKHWRLPRVPESQRLARLARHVPASCASCLPGAPLEWHWTATSQVDTSRVNPYNYGNIRRGVNEESVNRLAFLHGWAVHSGSGEADAAMAKKTRLVVRLVRTLEP